VIDACAIVDLVIRKGPWLKKGDVVEAVGQGPKFCPVESNAAETIDRITRLHVCLWFMEARD
jgi:hypothetical protein